MLTITSKDNANIKNTVKLKNSSKFRKKSGAFIAEGVRLCMDAMYSGAKIEILFATENAAQKYEQDFEKLSNYADKSFIVTAPIFAVMSDTETPQGFLCVIKALDKIPEFDTIKRNSKFIALENLQDPSNLGTILRTAEAFALDGIVLSADCCDIYSPKVVRGSMGAVFRIPFLICNNIVDFLRENQSLVSYAAVVSDAENITEVSFNNPSIAVIGNEGNGLRKETIDYCNHRITIPMSGKAESLNASTAASIIMWEMVK